MAECLNCGKHYDRPPGDLGSYCEACAKMDDDATLASTLNPEPGDSSTPKPPQIFPIVTILLVAANVIVFVFLASKGGPSFKERAGDVGFLIRWGAQFGPRVVAGEWWRLLTAMFLHGSISHLGLNMIYLWFIGKQMERVGRVRYLILYFLSGFVGGITSLLWDPMVASVGASGAIFGLFGAFLSPRRINRNTVFLLLLFIFFLVAPGATQKHVDFMGHLGGIVAGVLLGLALSAPEHDGTPKNSGRFAAATAGVAAAVLAGSLYAKAHYAYLPDFVQGSQLFHEKKFTEALPFLQRSLQFRPNSADANGVVGETLFRAQRDADAIPFLQRATQLKPGDGEWWYLLGLALLNTGKNSEAVAALLHVVDTEAQDDSFAYDLGLAYFRLGDPTKAKDWLKTAADAHPDDPKSNALLGHLYLQQGNTEQAFKYLYDAVALDPGNLMLQRDMGMVCMRRGNFDFAVGYFTHALRLSNGDERDRKALAAAKAALNRQP